MSKVPIGDLAEVMVGLVLKRREAAPIETKKSFYKALTLRSFNPEGWIDQTLLDDFESAERLSDRYLGIEGDVIIKLTPPYTVVAISKSLNQCVVPSQFAIIRCNQMLLISEYLAMVLNTDRMKKSIILGSTGVTVPMVKTGTIRDIEIPLPSLEKQRKFADIARLIVQERHLLNELVSAKEKYYQALIETIIMEESK